MKLTQLGFLITVKLYTWVFWRWGCLRSSVPVKTLGSQPFGILKVHSPWEYLGILVPGNTLGSLSLGLSQVFIPSEYIGFTVPGNTSGSQSLWISWRGADPCNLYRQLSPGVAYTSPNEFCHLIGLFWFARSRKCPLSEPLLFLHLTILAHGNTFLLNFLGGLLTKHMKFECWHFTERHRPLVLHVSVLKRNEHAHQIRCKSWPDLFGRELSLSVGERSERREEQRTSLTSTLPCVGFKEASTKPS